MHVTPSIDIVSPINSRVLGLLVQQRMHAGAEIHLTARQMSKECRCSQIIHSANLARDLGEASDHEHRAGRAILGNLQGSLTTA